MSSIKELGLAEGKEAYAIIKSTEVMIADGAESAREWAEQQGVPAGRRRGKRYCKGRDPYRGSQYLLQSP